MIPVLMHNNYNNVHVVLVQFGCGSISME